MRIERKHRIYTPDGTLPWAQTHAMNPTVDVLGNGRLRIFFSSLDAYGIGRIGYVEVNEDNPGEILFIAPEPVLNIGDKGTFDDNGIVPSAIQNIGEQKYLYYFGFQKVEKVRFLLFTGLAISNDGGISFTRFSKTPILDRTPEDLYVRSLPHLLFEDGKSRLWYSGVNKWIDVNGRQMPFGEIKYAESVDCIHFTKPAVPVLTPYENEFSLSRAFVFKENDGYKMIFSRRMKSDTYKLGYAESEDGLKWQRKDDKLTVSESNADWDNEMICYTSVVKLKNKTYVFYNGNGIGKTGFGYGELISN